MLFCFSESIHVLIAGKLKIHLLRHFDYDFDK